MSLGGGDLQVILRRIRNGFIVCDDSELCDKIITQDVESEQRRRNLAKSKSIDVEKTDLLNLLRTEPDFVIDELSHSPEWTATNVQVRRVRCETLGRLDEIKTENEAKRKVQVISWQDPPKAHNTNGFYHSDDDLDDSADLFQRRTEPVYPLVRPSPLTVLLQSAMNIQNPFAQYAKFDGTPNISSNQSKRFFVYFQSQRQKFQVIVCSSATVTETIGYICYKYTIDNREPVLTQKDPSRYSLHIADDDGEPEEFPPLTNERPIGQYDFPHLILIENITQPKSSITSTNSTTDLEASTDDSNEGSLDDSSRSVTPPVEEHRKSSSSVGKVSISNVSQDVPTNADPINNLNRLYESLNQRSYVFDYYVKLGGSKHVKVRIDVSGEQVRFDLLEKTSRLTWQSMPLTTQHLVDCNLLDKDKYKRKDRIRVYLVFENQQGSDGSNTYQTYELESTVEIAEQFREQILNIIKLKNPQGREIYEQQQQQRENNKKRRSFLNIFGAGPSGNS